MEQHQEPRKRSIWAYVGIGCGVLVLIVVVLMAGLAFWGYRTFRNMEAEMKDPVKREARVKEVLGCRTLPSGYYPLLSFSIPWVMDMAILSDRDVGPEGDERPFDKRGFIYVKTMASGGEEKAREYFEGRADLTELLKRARVEVTNKEEIARGTIEGESLRVHYIAHRGSLRIRGETVEGITSQLFFDCPDDSRFRMGIWFAPEAGEGGAEGAAIGAEGAQGDAAAIPEMGDFAAGGAPQGGEASYEGTPADESAIREFISHFEPCSA